MNKLDHLDYDKWYLYLADCANSNVEPSIKDYLVWLDEQALNSLGYDNHAEPWNV